MIGRLRNAIFGHRKLGRKAIAALVAVEITAALAIAWSNHGGDWDGGQPGRATNASMFESTAGGLLSAPSLSAF